MYYRRTVESLVNREESMADQSTQRSVEVFGRKVVRDLLDWYADHMRPFPWREERDGRPEAIRDPWSVLVSEVMLQQTQTSRVVEHLPTFLDRFPDPGSLARASTAEVIRAWSGLGYNNRAVRLQRAARAIVQDHDGRVPEDHDKLVALPGVGAYTAGAVECFAFGHDVPLIEVNIVRTLTRIFFGTYDRDDRMPEETIAGVSARLMPSRRAADWNQALMDLGALVCTASRPACRRCPVASTCLSAGRLGELPLFHPVRQRRSREPRFLGRPIRLVRGDVVTLLRKREEGMIISRLFTEIAGPEASGPRLRQTFIDLIRQIVRDGVVVVDHGESSQISESDRVRLPEEPDRSGP